MVFVNRLFHSALLTMDFSPDAVHAAAMAGYTNLEKACNLRLAQIDTDHATAQAKITSHLLLVKFSPGYVRLFSALCGHLWFQLPL